MKSRALVQEKGARPPEPGAFCLAVRAHLKYPLFGFLDPFFLYFYVCRLTLYRKKQKRGNRLAADGGIFTQVSLTLGKLRRLEWSGTLIVSAPPLSKVHFANLPRSK